MLCWRGDKKEFDEYESYDSMNRMLLSANVNSYRFARCHVSATAWLCKEASVHERFLCLLKSIIQVLHVRRKGQDESCIPRHDADLPGQPKGALVEEETCASA